MGTWWDESHNGNTMTEGDKFCRSQGRRGEGVFLYVKKWVGCEEFLLRNSYDQFESLRFKIRDQIINGHGGQGLPLATLSRRGGLLMKSSCFKRQHVHRFSS